MECTPSPEKVQRDRRQFWLGIFILAYLIAFLVVLWRFGFESAFWVLIGGGLVEGILGLWVAFVPIGKA